MSYASSEPRDRVAGALTDFKLTPASGPRHGASPPASLPAISQKSAPVLMSQPAPDGTFPFTPGRTGAAPRSGPSKDLDRFGCGNI